MINESKKLVGPFLIDLKNRFREIAGEDQLIDKEEFRNGLGIENYEVQGAPNASYAVATGKALPLSARTENANDDVLATKDPLFGIYKFTPSQVIAQTIAAMDDKLDERRPQFSTSAEVGAVMIIVAYKDMSLN